MTFPSRGISPELYRRLQQVLLRCGPFDSNAELRTLFIDARLNPWRDRVPEASNRQSRVLAVISMLADAYNADGDHALVLFLQTVRDLTPEGTACREELAALAGTLTGAGGSAPSGSGEHRRGSAGRGGSTTYGQQGQVIHGSQINVAGNYVVQSPGEGDAGAAGTGGVAPSPSASAGAVSTGVLRRRLQRYDDVQLETFCMDYFPEVYDRFGRGQRRDEKVNMLLDYCRRRPEEGVRLAQLLDT
jgi:hypothetical protein